VVPFDFTPNIEALKSFARIIIEENDRTMISKYFVGFMFICLIVMLLCGYAVMPFVQ
jgi:Na+/proline symporter